MAIRPADIGIKAYDSPLEVMALYYFQAYRRMLPVTGLCIQATFCVQPPAEHAMPYSHPSYQHRDNT